MTVPDGARLSDDGLRALGRSLREIDPTALSVDAEEGRARWMLGDAGTELFSWTHEGALVPHHVQLVFSRRSVEWSVAQGLVTGEFAGMAAMSGGRFDPYLLQTHASVDLTLCRAARTLLEASPLPALELGGMLGALEVL